MTRLSGYPASSPDEYGALSGKNKKEAEQNAAQAAYDAIIGAGGARGCAPLKIGQPPRLSQSVLWHEARRVSSSRSRSLRLGSSITASSSSLSIDAHLWPRRRPRSSEVSPSDRQVPNAQRFAGGENGRDALA